MVSPLAVEVIVSPLDVEVIVSPLAVEAEQAAARDAIL
jgi:hypothetical protein